MYPSTVATVKDFVRGFGTSTIKNAQTGTAAPYADQAGKLDVRVFSSREHFEMVDSQFREQKDLKGNSMLEIARRYWDDPEYAEQLRKEIAEGKRRGR